MMKVFSGQKLLFPSLPVWDLNIEEFKSKATTPKELCDPAVCLSVLNLSCLHCETGLVISPAEGC